jgi:hypothetical protein
LGPSENSFDLKIEIVSGKKMAKMSTNLSNNDNLLEADVEKTTVISKKKYLF